ncbi:MAG: citramalate synthase [Deltaproteobacteria bacterium]|nr:citramalate synthase [Deltaproteobacteria bacterium]
MSETGATSGRPERVGTARVVQLYDTTLRDGCQGEDVAFTLEDKLRIAERLDAFGMHYLEGGWPGSNPRDAAFFTAVRQRRLGRTRVAAFGATRRPGVTCAADRNVRMLLEAETPVVTIVGRTWDLPVLRDLRIPLEENLELIADTVGYLRSRVDEVIFDAEHFFDGHRAAPEYALACIRVAAEAGATLVCLCDTRGGSVPAQVAEATAAARAAITAPVGIHCHNDAELAVANSLAAVAAGAVQVQGTINGIGERCGNANLCSIVATLQLKLGYDCVAPAALADLQALAHFIDELANHEPVKNQPYVGQSAFAHKGGLHVAAVQREREIYEHVDPALVGNRQRVLLSDLSGRSNLVYKAREFGIDVDGKDPEVQGLLDELKALESRGYQFEGAEASFELLMQRALHGYARRFRLIGFRVIDEKRIEHEPSVSEATIMLAGPDGQIEHTAATGNGPVQALDRALRKALIKFFPEIDEVALLDFKVRVLGSDGGTGAVVRVLIESGDARDRWGTVGVSSNLVEASWQALVDSLDYKLYKDARARAAAVPGTRTTAGPATARVAGRGGES